MTFWILFLVYMFRAWYLIYEVCENDLILPLTSKTIYHFIFFPLILVFKIILVAGMILNFLTGCFLLLFFIDYIHSDLFNKIYDYLEKLLGLGEEDD